MLSGGECKVVNRLAYENTPCGDTYPAINKARPPITVSSVVKVKLIDCDELLNTSS